MARAKSTYLCLLRYEKEVAVQASKDLKVPVSPQKLARIGKDYDWYGYSASMGDFTKAYTEKEWYKLKSIIRHYNITELKPEDIAIYLAKQNYRVPLGNIREVLKLLN